jgi:hypothetical protein
LRVSIEQLKNVKTDSQEELFEHKIKSTIYEGLYNKQKPEAFNPHKIRHVENADYARKEYLTRLFLAVACNNPIHYILCKATEDITNDQAT